MVEIKKDELEAIYNLGFAIHLLRKKSKVPLNSGWSKGPRESWEKIESQLDQGFNVGVRLGEPSRLIDGTFLAIVDIDVKSADDRHAREALKKAFSLFRGIGMETAHVRSGRGNGSMHFYVRTREPVKSAAYAARSNETVKVFMPSVQYSQKEKQELSSDELENGVRLRPAWEVSLLSAGRQCVLPPSIHPDTKAPYEWGEYPLTLDDIPLVSAHAGQSGALKPTAAPSPLPVAKTHEIDRLPIKAEFINQIKTGEGVEDRSAALFTVALAMYRARVPEDTIRAVLLDRSNFLGVVAYEHAKTDDSRRALQWLETYTLKKAKQEIENTSLAPAVIPIGDDEKPTELTEDWQKKLDIARSKEGDFLRPTFNNALLILQHDVSPALVRRNLFSNDDTWGINTPWGAKRGQKRVGNKDDELAVREWLIENWHVEFPTPVIEDALNRIAVKNGYHPVKDYLESLEWDGVPRIETAFKRYLKANAPEPYLSEISRKFFLALVTRIYEPGAKFDTLPVFEGPQGIGKTSFGEILVGKRWHLDGLPKLTDKDAAVNIQGIWLVEFGELSSIYRSDREAAKSFITRTVDKFRPPYGHRRQDFPRQTLFYGTTDKKEYLTDDAGNRRYWPVPMGALDFEGVERDRDQLFAEAKWTYDNLPEPLWLEGEAKAQAVELQSQHMIDSESDDMPTRFRLWIENSDQIDGISLYSLFDEGPFVHYPKNATTLMKAALVLRKFGYEKQKTPSGNLWFLEF